MGPNHENFNFLTVITPLKLNICTKITYSLLVNALVYDLKAKKIASSKDHFCNLRVSLPGGCKYFREYLRENENIFENILGYCSRAQVLWIHAKKQTELKKTHATAPLKHVII